MTPSIHAGLITGSVTDFGRFLLYRTMAQPQRDAWLLRRAMAGIGCNDKVLIEILSTRTNQELKDAAAAYTAVHHENLVERIKSETGGFGAKWYGRWIDTLVQFDRNETAAVAGDPTELAEILYRAGEGKFGCDEQKFIDVLCQSNEPTCLAIAKAYGDLPQSKMSLEAAVKSEMGGDLEFAVLARVLSKVTVSLHSHFWSSRKLPPSMRQQTEFLAQRIYKACKGWGTDEETIARILGCLTKKEAEAMAVAYNTFYSKEEAPFNNFRKLLESELSGSFLDALNALIDQPTPKGHSTPEAMYAVEAAKVPPHTRFPDSHIIPSQNPVDP